jgi:hypothetical protein
MKLIKITSIALLAGFLVAGSGCVRKLNEFGDTNLNPGIVAEPITAALFTNVLSNMGGEIWSVTLGLYSQLYSETQYTEASRYARTQADFGGYYSGVLYDCQNIINFNTTNAAKAAVYGANENQIGIARILKAWWFLRVVDAWGKVPYSEALKFNGQIKYDDDQAIYTDLFKELKEAAAQLNASKPAFQGDILLGGNIAKWKKFANSLRVIMGIRIAKADPAKGKAELEDAVAGGVIENNSDNVMLAYPGGNFNNPFYTYYNITQRLDYAISATLADFMNNNGDKRVFAYGVASTTDPTKVKGFPYGLTRNNAIAFSAANPDWSKVISNSLRTATMPVPILTASQVYLARAEAAQRGWNAGGTAATLYSLGIQRGWEQWGVYNATDFAAYLAKPDIALTPGTEIAKIATQRWLAAFPDGQEAFDVWRSTGYPVLVPAPGTTSGIPRRLAIAQAQFDLNPENTRAVATAYTVNGESDSQYARVWWDKP